MGNNKKFTKAIKSLGKNGIVYNLNSTELNPIFLKFNFMTGDFNVISTSEVMKLFDKSYGNNNDFTYIDVADNLVPVDSKQIKEYNDYRNNIIDSDVEDMDIDVLDAELLTYLKVYNQLYKEVEDPNSSYDSLKQICINHLVFSDGSNLHQYILDKAHFRPVNIKAIGLFDFPDVPEIPVPDDVYDKLASNLIKIPDIIKAYSYYKENEDEYNKKGSYLTILNIIDRLKKLRRS